LPASATLRVVIEPDRETLYRRIEERLDSMVGHGALQEVRAVLQLRLSPDLPVMKAIGVRQFAAVLDSTMTLPEAVERAKTETRRYAKRQLTWFRNQMRDWPRSAG
ncbi:MAG TPA: tRNA (adenosine(37)-N6)-dimethylallyltransferase MiaA, partial [Propylenella sp.]|nr:tRNA (adenosine(37)-N6)-dimethylallyltransferase MiaA [Propylenella sp.]